MLTADVIQEAESIIEADEVYLLDQIGRGMFKQVYMLPSGSAVLKVAHYDDAEAERVEQSFEFEWAVYVDAHRNGWGQFFPATVFIESELYGLCMVQEICDSALDRDASLSNDWHEFVRTYGVYDLHSGNIGWTTDPEQRSIILDWGFDDPVADSRAETVLLHVMDGKPLPEPINIQLPLALEA